MINLDLWLDLKNWTNIKEKGSITYQLKPTTKMASPILNRSPAERKMIRQRMLPVKLESYVLASSSSSVSEKSEQDQKQPVKTTDIKVKEYTLNKEKCIKKNLKKLGQQ